MTLVNLKANMTEFHTDKATILFSYSTPVAAFLFAEHTWVQTSKKHSTTTSRHISQWLGPNEATELPQEFFDDLANPRPNCLFC